MQRKSEKMMVTQKKRIARVHGAYEEWMRWDLWWLVAGRWLETKQAQGRSFPPSLIRTLQLLLPHT